MKSPKSRYSPLDRGALTIKVCRHNSCLYFLIFIKMCTEMDQQKLDSKSEILDIHVSMDFHGFPIENLGIQILISRYRDFVPINFCQFFFSNASMVVVDYSKVWLKTKR